MSQVTSINTNRRPEQTCNEKKTWELVLVEIRQSGDNVYGFTLYLEMDHTYQSDLYFMTRALDKQRRLNLFDFLDCFFFSF